MKSNSERLNDSLITIRSTIKELDEISIALNKTQATLYETYKDMRLIESDLLALKRVNGVGVIRKFVVSTCCFLLCVYVFVLFSRGEYIESICLGVLNMSMMQLYKLVVE